MIVNTQGSHRGGRGKEWGGGGGGEGEGVGGGGGGGGGGGKEGNMVSLSNQPL